MRILCCHQVENIGCVFEGNLQAEGGSTFLHSLIVMGQGGTALN